MMQTYYLKVHMKQFDAVRRGAKTHEVRMTDVDYRAGDMLILREFDPYHNNYTGKCIETQITYVTKGGRGGLPSNLCVMSLRRVTPSVEYRDLVEDMPQDRRPYNQDQDQDKKFNDDVDISIDDDDGEDDGDGNK